MSNTSQYIIGLKQTKCGVETVKFREKLWTDEETKSLIATYKQSINMFSDHKIKVCEAWQNISDILLTLGIRKSAKECDKKFRNLKNAFKRVHFDTERSESSKYQWNMYEELLDVFVSDKTILRRTKAFEPIQMTKEGENMNLSTSDTIRVDSENDGSSPLIQEQDCILNDHDFIETTDSTNSKSSFIVLNDGDSNYKVIEESLVEDVEFPSEGVEEIPVWFQNFLIKYESDLQTLKSSLNTLVQEQKIQNLKIDLVDKKLSKIESKLKDH